MSSALNGLVVVVGGTVADLSNAIVGTTINVDSNPDKPVAIVAEVIGVAGVPGAVAKSIILNEPHRISRRPVGLSQTGLV